MNNSISGIYIIENKINNNRYIGQSTNIPKRWKEHILISFNSNSPDYELPIHRAIRKYGVENFSFSILEECEKENLNEKEIYWINKYNTYNNGYNANRGGDCREQSGKTVELYDFDGNYVKEYSSIKETAEKLNVSYSVVCQVIYGKRKSTRGYQLKLKNSDKIIEKYNSNQGGSKAIEQIGKDGEVVQLFNSSYDASRQLGLDASAISKCCRNKLKTCGGYKWRYAL